MFAFLVIISLFSCCNSLPATATIAFNNLQMTSKINDMTGGNNKCVNSLVSTALTFLQGSITVSLNIPGLGIIATGKNLESLHEIVGLGLTPHKLMITEVTLKIINDPFTIPSVWTKYYEPEDKLQPYRFKLGTELNFFKELKEIKSEGMRAGQTLNLKLKNVAFSGSSSTSVCTDDYIEEVSLKLEIEVSKARIVI